MAMIALLDRKCDGCGKCVAACPFAALEMKDERPQIGVGCRLCGLCVKACKKGALQRLEARREATDLSLWKGLLVVCETEASGLPHPVCMELIGAARALAHGTNQPVIALALGSDMARCADELRRYGADQVRVFDSEDLSFFRADVFATCCKQVVDAIKPAVVLIGATAAGRSLAPRLAARLRTGLTADCTKLEWVDSSLKQIRPAFGGNIMARIETPLTRPQMATVRYRVMDAPPRAQTPSSELVYEKMPRTFSPVRLVCAAPVPKAESTSDAEILVVGGRGLKRETDLNIVRELAALLGGEWATSRPLVEKGWAGPERQIGLSGRTVKPRLILTLGVSGAIQFAACMSGSEHIISVNTDPEAPIFKVAHVALVGDLYDVAPQLIARLKEGGAVL